MQQAPNNMTCHPHTCLIIKDQTSEAEEYGRLSGICCDRGDRCAHARVCLCVHLHRRGKTRGFQHHCTVQSPAEQSSEDTNCSVSPAFHNKAVRAVRTMHCSQPTPSQTHYFYPRQFQEQALVPNWRCRKNMLPVRSASENITEHYTAQQGTAGTEKEVLKKLEISWGERKHFSLDNL